DGVQRVEEEVRVELHPERLQLRLRELRFELRGPQLPLARFAVVVERVADPDERPPRQEIEVSHNRQQRAFGRAFENLPLINPGDPAEVNAQLQRGDDEAERQVKQRAT